MFPNQKIDLSDLFKSSSLISRQAARELFEIISKTPSTEIILDFNSINFASRSFFDELNSQRSKISLLGKKVEFMNLNENLNKLLEIVISEAKSRNSMSYASVANIETVTI